jgi:hypothetical protein
MSNWKEFTERNTFEIEVDGAMFRCARPSGAQLVARGVLPPALILNKIDRGSPEMNGDRHRVLLDEKAQDALLDAVLIEPKIWDGDFAACPEGMVPRRALASVRDVLVVTILSQLYDTEVVRGAAFRDGEGGGGPDEPGGDEAGPDRVPVPRPAVRRPRRRAGVPAGG